MPWGAGMATLAALAVLAATDGLAGSNRASAIPLSVSNPSAVSLTGSRTTGAGADTSADPRASALRNTSKLACIASKRDNSDSKSCDAAASDPMLSISDSILCAISPRRMAPASRALPLRVCNARSTSMRALRLSGRADHCLSAPPSCGINSAASSSKIGKRSASIASVASMSSSPSGTKSSVLKEL